MLFVVILVYVYLVIILFQYLVPCLTCISGKEKKKQALLLPDFVRSHSDDPESVVSPETSGITNDVLVVSLGVVNDCPGMMEEQKVIHK